MNDEDNEDLSYQGKLRQDIDTAKKRIESFENSTHVMMTCALNACQGIHVAFCLSKRVDAKEHLTKAMHSALIVAEQCRQEMAKETE